MSYEEIIKNQLPNRLYKDNGTHNKELKVLGDVLDNVQQEVDRLELELLIPTAEGKGLDKYYEFLGIPKIEDQPVSQRRSTIIGRIRGNATITKELIQSVAESYNKGSVDIIEYFDRYTFVVKFIDTVGIPANIRDLMKTIEDIKPAHLKVEYSYRYVTIGEVNSKFTVGQFSRSLLTKFAPIDLK